MKKCIIADDARVVRMVSAKILENLGFEVVEVEDGEEALEELEEKLPDLLILDWKMPVVDGIDVMRRVKKMEDGDKVKIIFCSAVCDLEKIQSVLNEGADDYIIKPFDHDIIQSKLTILGLL